MEPSHLSIKSWSALLIIGLLAFLAAYADAEIIYREFIIEASPVDRLCKRHNIITVNGQFPGPTLGVRNGDDVVVKVINRATHNITIHWHGIRQLRNPWADGPEYVTQCPIMPGQSYSYKFTIIDQEGTLWWHAHSRWLRATVHGAFIIYPKLGSRYPFLMPKRELPILLGQWWDTDPMSVLQDALITGGIPKVSDALTINGQPGDLYRCSSKEAVRFLVNPGETILLRIINSAMNHALFFGIANHKLTVVAADAAYTKPFTTNVIMIDPGQTFDALLTADQPPAQYYMAAHVYSSSDAPFDNTTTTAILEYKTAHQYKSAYLHDKKGKNTIPIFPVLPGFNDIVTATNFTASIRSPHQVDVPTEVEEKLFFAVGLGLINCSRPSNTCQGPNNTRLAASINNVSFVLPRTSYLMKAYSQSQPDYFTTDFPAYPPVKYDYTGIVPRGLWQPAKQTKLYKLKYGTNVQVILQDTSIISIEQHPMHLHGYNFFVVGMGFGNFDPQRDPATFNLIDPPVRNTVGTLPGGWVAIRFVADNPGIWLLHCHIDTHLPWGLAMAFLVENGASSVRPPPGDLPTQC